MRIPPVRIWLPLLLLFARGAYAAPGDLDPTFGTGGVVVSAVGASAEGHAAVLQADGKIVVAGSSAGAIVLLRYLPNGSPDPSFGSAGVVTTAIGDGSSATGLVLQPDGKLVAAGTSISAGQPAFAIVRYHDDGTLDADFGSGGIVTTPLPGAAVYGLARQADDKLVAAGTSNGGDGGAITLARYATDGGLDPAFGTAGIVTTSLGANADVAYAVAVQPDQKIVACGRDSSGAFALARYDTSGHLDAGFGSGGVSSTPAFGAPCHALAVGTDGKIVGVGSGSIGGISPANFAVIVRVVADGTLDSTFIGSPTMFFPYGVHLYSGSFGQDYQVPRAVAVDGAGRTVFGGMYAMNVTPGVPHVTYAYDFYAARLNRDGTEDVTFPRRVWSVPGGANALLLQPGDKGVAVGVYDASAAALRFLTGSCGNGTVDAGEACDDANGVNGDGCDGNCTVTACGNGILSAGETCDDGNVVGGDCCDPSCGFEPAGGACTDDGNECSSDVCNSAGRCTHPAQSGTCDDGDPCTLVDTCVFGVCQGSQAVECQTCETCQPDGSCSAALRPACAPAGAPGASRLKLKDKSPNKGDQVQWQWTHGTATVASFGDPRDSDDYAVCVFDQSGVVPTVAFSARIPAGGLCGTAACWRANAKGFRYKNKVRTPDGAESLLLTSGTGKAKIRFQGVGDLLTGRPGGLPTLPLAVPLRVQLQAESGACWEATFSSPATNEAGRLDAKSD